MELLKLAILSHGSDVIIGVEELASLAHGQVKVNLIGAIDVVMLDCSCKERQNLVLDLIIVHQGFITMSDPVWHLDCPLDIV